jgi:hypothetical protein
MRLVKLFTFTAIAAALVVTPVALAASATSTPSSVKIGHSVTIKVTGMKGGEKIKAVETLPFGQKRTIYPSQATSHSGVVILNVKAQVKGTHHWTITGRTSKRTAKTSYYVKA